MKTSHALSFSWGVFYDAFGEKQALTACCTFLSHVEANRRFFRRFLGLLDGSPQVECNPWLKVWVRGLGRFTSFTL